ncbi:MAG TPA: GNAT family N-acetyltransferase [Marmoricola sp.]|nr:GNAT family N-acetyltransferase [Marmoricola sp.]
MRIEVPRASVRAGEGWLAAAERRAADVGLRGPVLAVDLSADPLVFGVDDEHWFAVRPMTRGDFRDVSRWVSRPHVARWWDRQRSLEEVAEHYGPALDGDDPTRMWVFEVNGRSVGFGQDYRIGDHPDYALLTGKPDAVGIDYAIGEPAFVGRGLGTTLLWVLLRDRVVPSYDDLHEVHAAPDHRNAASLRVLAKLGFEQGTWFDEPQEDGRVDTVIGCTLDVATVFGDPAPSTG